MKSARELQEAVRTKYGAIAAGHSSGCCGGEAATGDAAKSASCCAGQVTTTGAEALGYRPEDLESVPAGADLGLGCGNPIDLAEPKPGETILDLGSGAGIDCFLAARAVGPTGRVIGVDFTPAMIEKARVNAARVGAQIDFRLGAIEQLPVESESVDAVISNCVINLSTDKPRVFAEAFRVLRPGGRLAVSDIVLGAELPPAVRDSVEAYAGCVAGASLRETYLTMIRDAGFVDVTVAKETGYASGDGCAPAGVDPTALAQVRSLGVRARKPVRA